MAIHDQHIGRRVREVRSWRQVSLTATAQLAGITPAYLSLIERGLRPVTKRATLEALATALKVSPNELVDHPYTPTESSDTHAAITVLEDALAGWWVGEIPEVAPRPWPAVQKNLASLLQTRKQLVQAALLPDMIRDLLAVAADPEHRRMALTALMDAYYTAAQVSKQLRYAGLPTLAVERMRQAAEELDDPVLWNLAAWTRAHVLSGANRARQYQLAVAVADADPRRTRPEIRGMANLTAALASAAQGHADTAETHLVEAAEVAELIEEDASAWGHVEFGRTNVGIWRVAIGVELGHEARVREIAPALHLDTVSKSRQGMFWVDYGRSLLSDRKTQDRGLAALLRAEKLVPREVRTNVFAREAVADLLSSAQRGAGGRDLRGLAWRMGVAPTG